MYGEFGLATIQDLIVVPTGFLVSGSVLYDTVDYDHDMLLVKLDKEGELEWYKHFGGRNNESASRILCPDHETIYLFGTNDDQPLLYDRQALLLITDKEGIVVKDESVGLILLRTLSFLIPQRTAVIV